MSYTDFIEQNIAPYSAEKIGVYDSNGNRVGMIPLGGFKPSYGERLYRFGLLSDVHNWKDQTSENTEDFQRALAYFNEKESVWATCICGDISQQGVATEFKLYQDNVNAKSPNTPVYTTVGNHDATPSGLNTENWEKYTGCERCFEIVKNNDHFLFFGMNKYSLGSGNSTPYLETDIDWLEEKLEEYRNERCFVITHLFFPTRAGNLNNIYTNGNWLAGTQLTRIQALNDRYKNSIWFSGHSHWKWYLQKYQDRANIYRDNCGWCVHVPSCALPKDSDGISTSVEKPLESEGAIVDVYKNYIDIRGMDLKNGKYLPIAQYRLDTTLVNIDAKPIVKYTITNNLTNATNSNTVTTIRENSSYSATITANDGYTINSITVTMGGNDVSSTVISGNVITISSVTGDIVIEVTTTLLITNYAITNNLTNATNSNTATNIEKNTSYNATITANDGYVLNTVTVTMGGTDITSSCYSDGVISIASVTGNIVITVSTEVKPISYTEIPLTWTLGSLSSSNGSELEWNVSSRNCIRSDFIEIDLNNHYYFTIPTSNFSDGTSLKDSWIYAYNSDKTSIGRIEGDEGTNYFNSGYDKLDITSRITSKSTNAKYIRINLRRNSTSSNIDTSYGDRVHLYHD